MERHDRASLRSFVDASEAPVVCIKIRHVGRENDSASAKAKIAKAAVYEAPPDPNPAAISTNDDPTQDEGVPINHRRGVPRHSDDRLGFGSNVILRTHKRG